MTMLGNSAQKRTADRWEAAASQVSSENDMSKTDSGNIVPDDSVEPDGYEIKRPRWQFEWSNIRDGEVFVR